MAKLQKPISRQKGVS